MKRIKQRLLSLAMAGALLLGSALPEAFAASAKSSNESSASETQTTVPKKNGKKQSKKKTADTQAEEKSSKTKGKASEKKEKASNKEVSLTLSISKPGGLSASGGVWQVDPDKVSALTLSWKCKGDIDSFEISVSGGVYSASTEKKSVKVPISGLSEGKYTATVKAIRDGKTVAKKKLSFQIVASSDNEASEEPASESAGNGDANESAIQQAQPEEGIPAEGENTAEAPQDPGEAETDPEDRESPEDDPAETAGNPEAAPVEEAQDTTSEPSVEQPQGPSQDQSADEAQDTSKEQPVEQLQDPAQDQSADEAQEASEEQPVEQAQDPAQDQSADEAQDTSEEQPVEQAQDPAQDRSADEAQEASEEQPDQEKDDASGETLVEETSDAEGEQPAPEESLDLSEPDIQTPQEDLIEGQPVIEEPFSDVILDASGEPEIQFAQPDEALELGEQSVKTELPEDNGVSVSANADNDKQKTDNNVILSVKGAEGVSVTGDEVHVNPAQASAVTLVWSFGGACDEYAVSVSGNVYDATTKKTQLKLPVKNLSAGQYTVTVAAKKDGKALSSARLSFIVDAADGEGETAGLAITVASPQGLLITEGVYQVDPAQAKALTLAWQYDGECDAYDVSISGDVYSGRTEDVSVTVPLSDLAAGTYTVTVVAIRDGEAVAQAQLAFNLSSQDEKPQEDPGKDGKPDGQPPGGGPRGGGPKGGAAKGDGQEADQGFRVTPGEPLIGTHTSGNRDMRLYGAVTLALDAESPMSVLTLGDTALDIRLSDGGLFTASLEADALALVPQGEAKTWLLNGYALKTLARSGITSLRLTLDDVTVEFPTLPELSGSNYGMLCAAGRTSREYSYAVTSNGCTVTVAGQSFQLTAEGELA